MNTESAIDLSMRSRSSSESEQDKGDNVSIVRPIPRPPWSIIWYQNLWPSHGNSTQSTVQAPLSINLRQDSTCRRVDVSENETCATLNVHSDKKIWKRKHGDNNQSYCPNSRIKTENEQNIHHRSNQQILSESESKGDREGTQDSDNNTTEDDDETSQIATIVDIACCDGPVRFERISNPNFALTVEHQNEPIPTNNSTPNNILLEPTCRNLATKTYLCIYCNQSFKSLFCYQKHKKRHLNPVSVDITGINVNTPMVCTPENKIKTKDLNVQFFPCKKCGCKFPSYYFVHKHKKTCH